MYAISAKREHKQHNIFNLSWSLDAASLDTGHLGSYPTFVEHLYEVLKT